MFGQVRPDVSPKNHPRCGTRGGEKPPRVAKAVRTGWLAPRPAPESHHRDEMEGFQIKTIRDGHYRMVRTGNRRQTLT